MVTLYISVYLFVGLGDNQDAVFSIGRRLQRALIVAFLRTCHVNGIESKKVASIILDIKW